MIFGRSDYNRRIIDTAGIIPDDEPCFLLRGNDVLAPKMLLKWAMELRLSGGDPVTASGAEEHAQAMIEWQKRHGCKKPDLSQISCDNKKQDFISILLKIRNDQGTSDDVVKLINIAKELFSDGNPIGILIPHDIAASSTYKTHSDLILDDFKSEELSNLKDCRVILFQDKSIVKLLKTTYLND